MADLTFDAEVLNSFERNLDPLSPEGGPFGARILGYGEMSTVLTLAVPGAEGLCFKRMPMFEREAEVVAYRNLYQDFLAVLEGAVGMSAAPSHLVEAGRHRGSIVVYIVQELLPPDRVVQRLLPRLSAVGLNALLQSALQETSKVFRFNQSDPDGRKIAVDGQLSNFGLVEAGDFESLQRGETVKLVYIDTSTPLMQVKGRERLNTELFLRSAPGWLKPALRALIVKDTVKRYYDPRSVAIDLLANLYKEQLHDKVPALVEEANRFFEAHGVAVAPIDTKDVQAYYAEDANMWRLYLWARKLDRRVRRLLGRPYPYILPRRITR